MNEQQDEKCRIDHNMLEYSISRLTEKIDGITSSLAEMNTGLRVMDSKVDDFSYRLKKVEERDAQVQSLIQKVDIIVKKLEPDVNRIDEKQRDFEKVMTEEEHKFDTRLTKIENNWGWVVAIASMCSGIIVAITQHIILQIFFK